MRRTALAPLLALLCAGATPAVASAASYEVTACRDAPGGANGSWEYVSTGPSDRLLHGDGCDAPGTDRLGGLWVREAIGGFSTYDDVSGHWRFAAPATTTISRVRYRRMLRTYLSRTWRSEILADNGAIDECKLEGTADTCNKGGPASDAVTRTGLAASTLRIGARCAAPAGITCGHASSADFQRVTAVLYAATVTIEDPLAPQADDLAGTLFAPGWVRGVRTAGLAGRDATGVRSLSLHRGGSAVRTTSQECDYTRPAPCPLGTQSSDWGAIDTTGWVDGEHELEGRVTDAAGNVATRTATVRVDNTPPAAPLAIAAGATWSAAAVRELSWLLPAGQAAPVAGATVRVCRRFTSECTQHPADSTTFDELALPGDGEWSVTAWLADAAGNVDPGNAASVVLGLDRVAPAAPVLGTPSAGSAARELIVPLSWSDAGPAPAQVFAERCDAAGAGCEPIAAGPGELRTTAPSAGTWIVRAWAIDAAGHRGPASEVSAIVADAPAGVSPGTPRIAPALRIARARLKGARLRVRARVPADAQGALSLRVKPKGRKAFVRRIRADGGNVRKRLRVARRVRRARVALRFAGDARYLPAAVRVTARRRARR